MITRTAKKIARGTKNNPLLHVLARVGFGMNGVLHILIGLIAIQLTMGTRNVDADESGALSKLASTVGGTAILWTVVAGLVALGLWIALAAFLTPVADTKRRWVVRIAELSKSAAYFVVAGTATTFALGSTSRSAERARHLSSDLLGTPGGVAVLVAAGVVVLGIGCYFVYKGVARAFLNDITVPRGAIGHATVAFGITGYVAKGIAVGTVGILLAVAAFTHDPSTAAGLDGSLRALLQLPFGVAVLCTVAGGLIAYGLYCFVRARRATL